MIEIKKADTSHIEGIQRVCIEGQRNTYAEIYSPEYLQRVIDEYYNLERLAREVTEFSREWTGYYVALDGEEVVGAAGGGMLNDTEGELFVLYLLPNRRRQGIGSQLLDAVTQSLIELGAKKQWASVVKENMKGRPFYEAKSFIIQHEREDEGGAILRYMRDI